MHGRPARCKRQGQQSIDAMRAAHLKESVVNEGLRFSSVEDPRDVSSKLERLLTDCLFTISGLYTRVYVAI